MCTCTYTYTYAHTHIIHTYIITYTYMYTYTSIVQLKHCTLFWRLSTTTHDMNAKILCLEMNAVIRSTEMVIHCVEQLFPNGNGNQTNKLNILEQSDFDKTSVNGMYMWIHSSPLTCDARIHVTTRIWVILGRKSHKAGVTTAILGRWAQWKCPSERFLCQGGLLVKWRSNNTWCLRVVVW